MKRKWEDKYGRWELSGNEEAAVLKRINKGNEEVSEKATWAGLEFAAENIPEVSLKVIHETALAYEEAKKLREKESQKGKINRSANF